MGPDVSASGDEWSMSGGARAVARFWADILFLSEAETTRAKWSMRKMRVACGRRIRGNGGLVLDLVY